MLIILIAYICRPLGFNRLQGERFVPITCELVLNTLRQRERLWVVVYRGVYVTLGPLEDLLLKQVVLHDTLLNIQIIGLQAVLG